MLKKALLSFCIIWSIACQDSHTVESKSNREVDELSHPHFTIKDSLEYTIIQISDPYLQSGIEERILLYPKEQEVPSGVSATVKVPIPVERVAINSTTHLGFLKAIGQVHSIRAASNPNLYYDAEFNQRITEGEVAAIGLRELNKELLIESNVDVLFSFAINAKSYQEAEQLRALGQNVILISEYMEHNPLQKAEWVKVFARFYTNKEQQVADSLFNDVSSRYRQLKEAAKKSPNTPSVTIGLPWKGTWYVSGGNSFQAQLIQDANARYIWQGYQQTASVPLDIETALSKGIEADYWINPGVIQTKAQLEEQEFDVSHFRSFSNDRVFTNYLRSTSSGANDYWETAVVRPDWVLEDLTRIFHSQEVDSLHYYKKVAE